MVKIGPQIRVILAITIALRLCAASVVWTHAAESATKSDRRAGASLRGLSTAAALASAVTSAKTPAAFDADREFVSRPLADQRAQDAGLRPAAHTTDRLRTPLGSRPPPAA